MRAKSLTLAVSSLSLLAHAAAVRADDSGSGSGGSSASAKAGAEGAAAAAGAVQIDKRADTPEGEGLHFYAAMVGGVHVETLQNPEDDAEGRTTTLALSRIGLRGQLSDHVYVESEFEVNAGPHGTSVWEGQAAMQVRNQLIRYMNEGFRVDVGRVTDPSSLDYYSNHVADQLLTDPYTRAPLLASGYNRGQGAYASYEVVDGLKPGLSLNAANPVSTTASLVVGGTFPPFSRFYFAAHQQVGRDASSFPADQYHIMLATPSVLYENDLIEAQTAAQLFRVNTDTKTDDDQNIVGYNLRAGLKLKLMDGVLTPFVNGSRVTNSVVDPNDGSMLADYAYVGYTLSTGIDYNFWDKTGIGATYSLIRGRQGQQSRTTEHFLNIGSSYYLTDHTAVGARASIYRNCRETPDDPCVRQGSRSYFVTMRTLL